MDLSQYKQALDGFISSTEFHQLDDSAQQARIKGVRDAYLEENPDVPQEDVDYITEATNRRFLRGTGRGRAIPDLNNIIFPNQEPGFKDLGLTEKNTKLEEFRNKIPELAKSNPTMKEDTEYFLNKSIDELDRRVNGEGKGRIRSMASSLGEGFLATLAESVGATDTADGIRRYFTENPEYDDEFFTNQLSQGVGSGFASVAIIAGLALTTKGLGGTAAAAEAIGTTGSLLTNGIMRYNEGYKNAIDAGLDEETASQAGWAATPAATIDALSDRILASGIMPAHVNKVFSAGSTVEKRAMLASLMAEQSAKGRLFDYAKNALGEGLSEAAGDYTAAYGPYLVTGNDKYLPTAKESMNSFLLGAVIGGGMTAGFDLPNTLGGGKGKTEVIQTPTGESKITPNYATATQLQLGETRRNLDQIQEESGTKQIYDLLANGQYKQAYHLSSEMIKRKDKAEQASKELEAAQAEMEAEAKKKQSANPNDVVDEGRYEAPAESGKYTNPAPETGKYTVQPDDDGRYHNPPDSGKYGEQSAPVAPEQKNNINEVPKVQSFVTAKGSVYQVHDDGTTTRDKAQIEGHNDPGLKPKSSTTFYVDTKGTGNLDMVATEGGDPMRIERIDKDKAGVKYTAGKNKGKFAKSSVTSISNDPAVGLTPVELWENEDGTQSYHFGHEITEVFQSSVGEPNPAVEAKQEIPAQPAEAPSRYAQPVAQTNKYSAPQDSGKYARKKSDRVLAAEVEAIRAADDLRRIMVGMPEEWQQQLEANRKLDEAVAMEEGKKISQADFFAAQSMRFKGRLKKGFDRMVRDIAAKNPGLVFVYAPEIAEDAQAYYDPNDNIIYLGSAKPSLRAMAHETAHSLTVQDMNTFINQRPEATYGARLAGAFQDPSTPEYLRRLIDVYSNAVIARGMQHVSGLVITQENIKDAKIFTDMEYAFTNLEEFVAESMSNPEFQEQMSRIPYEGKSLWDKIVEIFESAWQWISDVGGAEFVMRHNGNNVLATTLGLVNAGMGKNNIIENEASLEPTPVEEVKQVAEQVLDDTEKQDAAIELGFEEWSDEAAEAFSESMADWIVSSGKQISARLAELFRKVAKSIKLSALAIGAVVTFGANTNITSQSVQITPQNISELVPGITIQVNETQNSTPNQSLVDNTEDANISDGENKININEDASTSNIKSAYGYPVKTSKELGLDEYFKSHPDVAGMAWGGGENGSSVDEPRAVVHNPYNKNMGDPVKRDALYKIEAARHLMATNPIPQFKISPELQQWREANFKNGDPYREDDNAFRETVVSRIMVGDTGENGNMPFDPEPSKISQDYNKKLNESSEGLDILKNLKISVDGIPVKMPEPDPVGGINTNGYDIPQDVTLLAQHHMDKKSNGKSFVILDKNSGKMTFFDRSGNAIGSVPWLWGRNDADFYPVGKADNWFTTPAGEFTGELFESQHYGLTIWFDTIDNGDGSINRMLIHRRPSNAVGANPTAQRDRALASKTIKDNAATGGCANLGVKDAKNLIPRWDKGGKVYILPKTQEGWDMFTQATGFEKPAQPVVKNNINYLPADTVLYHGGKFNGKGQIRTSARGAWGSGIYFTPNLDAAKEYAKMNGWGEEVKDGSVTAFDVEIKNPIMVQQKEGAHGALVKLGVDPDNASNMIDKAEENYGYIGKEIMSRGIKAGHDGIEVYDGDKLVEAVVWNQRQASYLANMNFLPSDKVRKLGVTGTAEKFIYQYENSIEWKSVYNKKTPEEKIAEFKRQAQLVVDRVTSNDAIQKKANVDLRKYLESLASRRDLIGQARQSAEMFKQDPEGYSKKISDDLIKKRINGMNEWRDYLLNINDVYSEDPFFVAYVWNGITSNMSKSNTDGTPALDVNALGYVYEESNTTQGLKDFNDSYERAAERSSLDSVSSDNSVVLPNGTTWIKIPQTRIGDVDYDKNLSTLRNLSLPSWCTSGPQMSAAYIQRGPFWMLSDGGKIRMAIRFDGDQVAEIQGPANNGTIPHEYLEHVIGLKESGKLGKLSSKAQHSIESAINRQIEIAELKQMDPFDAMRRIGLDVSKDDDGEITLSNSQSAWRELYVTVKENNFIDYSSITRINSEVRTSMLDMFPNARSIKTLIVDSEGIYPSVTNAQSIDISYTFPKDAKAVFPGLESVDSTSMRRYPSFFPNVTILHGELSVLSNGYEWVKQIKEFHGDLAVYVSYDLENLEVINGNASLYNGGYPKLKEISGEAFIGSKVTNIESLETVGGELTLHGDAIAKNLRNVNILISYSGNDKYNKAPNLIEVNQLGNQTESESNSISISGLNSITTINGSAFFYAKSIAYDSVIERINGNLIIREGHYMTKLETLKEVGGNVDAVDIDFPNLEKIGGNLYSKTSSFPKLKEIGKKINSTTIVKNGAGEYINYSGGESFPITAINPTGGRSRFKKNNINYLPAQTQAKRERKFYQQLAAITSGNITDKADASTQKMIKIMGDMKPSDIARIDPEARDYLMLITENIYNARKSANPDPQMRMPSIDMIIPHLEAIRDVVNKRSVQKLFDDYQDLVDFSDLNPDLENDPEEIKKFINDYIEKNNVIELLEKKAAAKTKSSARYEKIQQKWRDEFRRIQQSAIERFADAENYVSETEALLGAKFEDPYLRSFIKMHFGYISNVDVSQMTGNKLYQHFFAINNLIDGSFRFKPTVEFLANQRNAQEGITALKDTFHDPVSNKGKFSQWLDEVNEFAELHQVQLQRHSSFDQTRDWLQNKLLIGLHDAISRTTYNRKIAYVKEFVTAKNNIMEGMDRTKDQDGNVELNTEDRVITSIVGRLVQFALGENPDTALLRNIKKERKSIQNIINNSTNIDNVKLHKSRVQFVFDELIDGLEKHGPGVMQHFMETLPQRMSGSEGLEVGQARLELLGKAQEIFSRFNAESKAVSEGFFGKPFQQYVNYMSNDVMSTDAKPRETWEMNTSVNGLDEADHKVSVKAEAGHLKERQAGLGTNDTYSYNLEGSLYRNIEKIVVDNGTIAERCIIAERLRPGSELNNIISLSGGVDVPHQGRVNSIKSMVVRVMRNATSKGQPLDIGTQTLRAATGLYAKATLSSIHHIFTQPLAAVIDYGFRTGNAAGWFKWARYIATNNDKVNAWLDKNSMWVRERSITEAMGLDQRRSPQDDSQDYLKNNPAIKWINKQYEKASKVMTFAIHTGDNFSVKATILAEYERLMTEKYGKSFSLDELEMDMIEGQIFTEAVMNAEKNINTSNKIFRGELFSDRRISTTIIRNLLFAFSSHQSNLATQFNQAVRDLRELKSLGAPKSEMESKVRTIAAITMQQVGFTAARFFIGGMTAKVMISLVSDLFDDEEGKISELETALRVAQKRGDPSKVLLAEQELANAQAVRKVITQMKHTSQSADSLFKQVMRDSIGSFHLSFNNGAMQQVLAFIPDAWSEKIYKDGQEKAVQDLRNQITKAKEKNNNKLVGRLTEQLTVLESTDYIPYAYDSNGGFGMSGIYGATIDTYKRVVTEANQSLMGVNEWNWTDFMVTAAAMGVGQAEFTKTMNLIDKIEDAQWKSNKGLQSKLEAAKNKKRKQTGNPLALPRIGKPSELPKI